jgi:hypothetical protein
MAQSIPINPSFGSPKSPWDPGGHNRGPIMSPPDIGDVGPISRERVTNRNRSGNKVMKVGKR